jgi:hypothetical protein
MKNQLWAVSIMWLLVGCGGETATPTAPVAPKATTITLSSSSVTLASLSGTAQLTATPRPSIKTSVLGTSAASPPCSACSLWLCHSIKTSVRGTSAASLT